MSRPTATAVHELGHYAVAEALGATNLEAVVQEDGQGYFTGNFDGSLEQEAVILLAGPEAAQLLAGRAGDGHQDARDMSHLPHGNDSDLRQVRRLLQGSDTTLGQARQEARRLVRQQRGTITRGARALDRQGHL